MDSHPATNNRAELYAAIVAIEQAIAAGHHSLVIRSDSTYVVESARSYLNSWKKKGANALKDRKNSDLWEKLDDLISKIDIDWQHVKGHSGILGNEAADKFAECAAAGKPSTAWSVAGLSDLKTSDSDLGNSGNVAEGSSAQNGLDTTCKTVQNSTNIESSGVAPRASCVMCKSLDDNKMIQCKKCNSWLHYSCTELPKYQIFLFHSTVRKFECEKCTVVPCDFSYVPKSVDQSVVKSSTHTQTDVDKQVSLSDIQPILVSVKDKLQAVTNLNDTLQDFESRLVTKLLNSRHSDTNDKLTECQKQLDVANGNGRRLSDELKSKSEKISSLSDELKSLKDQQHNKTCDNCEQLLAKKKSVQKQCEDLNAKNILLSSNISALQTKIKSLEADHADISRSSEGIRKECKSLQSLVDTKTDKILKLESDLQAARDKVSNLSEEVRSWKVHHQQETTGDWEQVPLKNKPSPEVYCNQKHLEQVQSENIPVIHLQQDISGKSDVAPINKSGNCALIDQSLDGAHSSNVYTHAGKPEVDVLIIGNSHTNAIDTSRIYKHKVCRVITLEDGEKNIDGAIKLLRSTQEIPSAPVVVFQVASNSLCFEDADSCVKKCCELIDVCKFRLPMAKVCFGEALPRKLKNHDQNRRYAHEFQEFNRKLRKIPGAIIIPHTSLMAMTDKLYNSGGVHLTHTGISSMIMNYKIVLNPILGLPEYIPAYNPRGNDFPRPHSKENDIPSPRHSRPHNSYNPRVDDSPWQYSSPRNPHNSRENDSPLQRPRSQFSNFSPRKPKKQSDLPNRSMKFLEALADFLGQAGTSGFS